MFHVLLFGGALNSGENIPCFLVGFFFSADNTFKEAQNVVTHNYNCGGKELVF